MPPGDEGNHGPARSLGRRILYVCVSLGLVGSGAYAALTVVYTTSSTQTLELKPPPVVWVAGPDSSGNTFVSSFALSSNATFFNVTIKPVPEANVTWGNFTTLKNQDTASYTVSVSGSSASAFPKVLEFMVEFRNYGDDVLKGTLNLKQASPSVSLGTMAAANQWYTKMWVKLDTGTGSADLPSSTTVTVNLTPL